DADQRASDDRAAGGAMQYGRRAQGQLQVGRDAQTDDRSVGAAVDQELVRPAAIDPHFHGHPRIVFLGVDVLAADQQLVVDHRRRQRRQLIWRNLLGLWYLR